MSKPLTIAELRELEKYVDKAQSHEPWKTPCRAGGEMKFKRSDPLDLAFPYLCKRTIRYLKENEPRIRTIGELLDSSAVDRMGRTPWRQTSERMVRAFIEQVECPPAAPLSVCTCGDCAALEGK